MSLWTKISEECFQNHKEPMASKVCGWWVYVKSSFTETEHLSEWPWGDNSLARWGDCCTTVLFRPTSSFRFHLHYRCLFSAWLSPLSLPSIVKILVKACYTSQGLLLGEYKTRAYLVPPSGWPSIRLESGNRPNAEPCSSYTRISQIQRSQSWTKCRKHDGLFNSKHVDFFSIPGLVPLYLSNIFTRSCYLFSRMCPVVSWN